MFSGCGTSGRMVRSGVHMNIHKSLNYTVFQQAWMCSRAYNRILSRFGHTPCFHYLIAGGDVSLIISNELPEDDPPQGNHGDLTISSVQCPPTRG